MAWWAAAALGVQAAGALGAFGGKNDAARQARAELNESLRRMRLEQDQTLGTARAAAAASGAEFDSNAITGHLARLSQEMSRELEWARRTGMREVSAMRRSAGCDQTYRKSMQAPSSTYRAERRVHRRR